MANGASAEASAPPRTPPEGRDPVDIPAGSNLADYLAPLQDDMNRVREFIARQLVPDDPTLSEMLGHVAEARGKMLRPALVLLAGQVAGALKPLHTELAAVVEMIHVASLLHDDVLDQATERRRRPTANHLYGNQAAVLLGDFVLSRIFEIIVGWPDPHFGRRLGRTAAALCQGELRQNLCRGNAAVDETVYLEVIGRKTAALFGAAAELGAYAAGAGSAVVQAMGAYGTGVGMAFQISDDVLDVIGDPRKTGKPAHVDLAQRTLTLPWIHFLDTVSDIPAQALWEQGATGSPQMWADRLEQAGSIAYARRRAQGFVTDAIEALISVPGGAARDRLEAIAGAIVARMA